MHQWAHRHASAAGGRSPRENERAHAKYLRGSPISLIASNIMAYYYPETLLNSEDISRMRCLPQSRPNRS